MMNICKYFLVFFGILIYNGCGSLSGKYSLSGSSIDPNWQTIYVSTFVNNASLQNPNLAQDLTISIQDIFRGRTKLTLTEDSNSDLIIEGEIIGYEVTPQDIKSNDIAANNRLTVTVKIHYINNKEESKSFDRNFSAYNIFEGDQTLIDVSNNILPLINKQITEQVFAAIAQDW